MTHTLELLKSNLFLVVLILFLLLGATRLIVEELIGLAKLCRKLLRVIKGQPKRTKRRKRANATLPAHLAPAQQSKSLAEGKKECPKVRHSRTNFIIDRRKSER
jgi:hypothetical protein